MYGGSLSYPDPVPGDRAPDGSAGGSVGEDEVVGGVVRRGKAPNGSPAAAQDYTYITRTPVTGHGAVAVAVDVATGVANGNEDARDGWRCG